jgi:acetyl-CoA carboxylase carboxyltransferase component
MERMLLEALAAIRDVQAHRPAAQRLQWNRILLYVWPPLTLAREEMNGIIRRIAPATQGVGLEQVVVRARMPEGGALRDTVIRASNAGGDLLITFGEPSDRPLRPLAEYEQTVVSLRRRGLVYPYELIRMLAPPRGQNAGELPPGEFIEHDLAEDGTLVPVERPAGQNRAKVVVALIRNFTPEVPEGMTRVIILGDASKEMGALAEPECARINAAIDLAERLGMPLEWFALSAGAKISMESGTENMDWISRVLRRLIEFTQAGGEVNVVVCGINVGAQPYWNAEATMLMHTRGILVMVPEGAMVLTGKQALDYSGGVSAEDNLGIGGYDRIMGPNGQAQYHANDLGDACRILLRHYEYSYVVPGEPGPRRAATTDPAERDVCDAPHGGTFPRLGDVFSEATNPGRKQPFDIRPIMSAVVDHDHRPLERWRDMRDAEIPVVWDARIGGHAVCVIGFESHPLPRLGFIPADGPDRWTGGTLFPRGSKKVARAINAASNNRPLVILANLSGFDGSPESMREWQLEYGAEIGRAVVNFQGPIVFVVISRYHGGAFVVFSKTLNERIEAAALEGSFASVIGGAPAAAVVFTREVDGRTAKDERVRALEQEVAAAPAADKPRLRARLAELRATVRTEKLGEVADEFDRVHSVERALRMGAIDAIIPAARMRPWIIEALERGLAAGGS